MPVQLEQAHANLGKQQEDVNTLKHELGIHRRGAEEQEN